MELSVYRLRQLAEQNGYTIGEVLKRKGGWRSVRILDAKGKVVPAKDSDWHTLLKAWNLLEAEPDKPVKRSPTRKPRSEARAP